MLQCTAMHMLGCRLLTAAVDAGTCIPYPSCLFLSCSGVLESMHLFSYQRHGERLTQGRQTL